MTELESGQVYETPNGCLIRITQPVIWNIEGYHYEFIGDRKPRVFYLFIQPSDTTTWKLKRAYGSPLWKVLND